MWVRVVSQRALLPPQTPLTCPACALLCVTPHLSPTPTPIPQPSPVPRAHDQAPLVHGRLHPVHVPRPHELPQLRVGHLAESVDAPDREGLLHAHVRDALFEFFLRLGHVRRVGDALLGGLGHVDLVALEGAVALRAGVGVGR